MACYRKDEWESLDGVGRGALEVIILFLSDSSNSKYLIIECIHVYISIYIHICV